MVAPKRTSLLHLIATSGSFFNSKGRRGTIHFFSLSRYTGLDVQFPLFLAFMLICLLSLSGAVTSVSPPSDEAAKA